MREIVLDTETTGLDPFQGHRLIEIGCVELLNRIPSGEVFHRYLNPERDVPAEAFAIHGLSGEFLKDKPLFPEIADELLDFLGEAPLVIHNAAFDLGFINAELDRAGKQALGRDRIVDTLLLASALWLAWYLGQIPFVHGWITAKVLALIAYIVLGMVALRRGRTKSVRAAAFAAALAAAAYIVAVALTRDATPWS